MSGDDQSFERRRGKKPADSSETANPANAAVARAPEPELEKEPEPVPAPEPEHKPDAEPSTHAHRLWLGVKHRFHLIPAPIRWAVSLVVIVLVGIVLFLANPNWDWARGFVASIISGEVHRPTRIDGHLRVHLFSFTPDATLTGLHIGQPDWAKASTNNQNMADVGTIAVKAELMPVFIGRIVLPRLQIDQPTVLLYQDKAGQANWDFSNGAKAGQPVKLPLIKNFIINDGHLTITSLQRKLKFTGTVYAHETADAGGQAFGLTGQGSLNDKVFQMNATGGPLLNVKSSVPYPFDATVRAGDTRITAKGRVLHPFNLGQIDAAMSLSGNNLADLYYLTGLSLPDTPKYSISAQVGRDDMVYTIGAINGRVGGSDLEGKLKVDTSNHGRPDLTGDLSSRLLDFKDLGSLFGATAANKPSKPKLTMAPQATVSARRLLPDASLDVERVRGMDAKVHYRALSVNAPGLPLRQVSLGITLDHGLLALDPIDFTFPQGHLTGTARIDARQAVQTNAVDMRLNNVRIQDFTPKVQGAVPIEAVLNARLKATGSGDSVHKAAGSADGRLVVALPSGTIRQSLAELMGIDATKGLFLYLSKDTHQTDVRCAVADFTIHNGVMQAQSIVFDTGVVVVNGSGTVNLNDESMKLVFKGQPKKFRLVKLNAPIIIGGHLSAPTFGINPGPAIAQGGLAAVLDTVSPVLAAVPFLGLNGAKDANCGALLADAHDKGAPAAKVPVRHASRHH